ncbi:hypothetical protein N431DRAFT_426963 [Stipitochalara longipes BDJ]|nr:hypothetical protein N431DRAFT_426963 [Stipitochalara longipes BDJ]
MGRHHSRWAETKAGTSWYYNDVTRARAGGVRHPRERLYDDLDQAAITRNAPSVLLQLAPAAVGPVQVPFFDVESELYQIVADAWGLELIVVFDAVREQRRRLTLVRGDHNARQIFLLREADGSYTPLQPAVRDPADWRYSFHIPTKRKSMPNVGEWQESARFRSPYYQLGANGHLRRPRLPILEQAVGLPHLANARGALETPERVEDDPTPPSTVPNAFVHGYLNTGNWM